MSSSSVAVGAGPTDALAVALALWQRGLSVFPVPRPAPGVPSGALGDGKVPSLPWREFQSRRATEAEVRQWFARPQNVAIVTGAVSGVVAVDGDSPEAMSWMTRHLPYSPWQTRTSKGYHVFFQHPGTSVRNRARITTGVGRLALDVRGDGGFVIGPVGVIRSGGRISYAA